MARLPTVGGDSGNWGTVLNEYLETAHNTDGTLKLDVKTIADLKAIDVATLTDKQQALVAGYSAAGDGGGGVFYYDAGSGTADNGGTVIAPTAGSGRWKRIYSGSVNVKWFGAKGDGTTDDTASIRAAFLAATSESLFFGSGGTYLVTGASTTSIGIQVSSNTTVYGYGATLKLANGQPALSAVVSIYEKVNVRIFGLTIDGNKANQSTSGDQDGGTHGVRILGSDHIYLSDVTIQDCETDGIYISTDASAPGDETGDNSSNIYIKNCVCDGNKRQGMSVIQVTGLFVDSSHFINTAGKAPQAGIDFEPNNSTQNIRNVRLTNCVITSNLAEGIVVLMRGGILDDFIVEGCRILSNGNESIQFNCNEASTLRNITVRNCVVDNQIRFGRSGGDNSSVWLGNIVEGCTFIGANSQLNAQFVESTARSLTVRNCDFSQSTKNPTILVNLSDGVLIDGCTRSGVGAGDAIRVLESNNVQIVNNHIYNPGTGIVFGLPASQGVIVSGNHLDDCNIGIYTDNGVTNCLAVNNLIENCTTGISGVSQLTVANNMFNNNGTDSAG